MQSVALRPREARRKSLPSLVSISSGCATNGDYEATFHLKQPQPALLALLASGYSPVYPCHVPPQDMRQHPIGTGHSNSSPTSRTRRSG
jgi:peptide/nickel transport system substrate-binding protein